MDIFLLLQRDPEYCKRWIQFLARFYIFLIIGPILYCAIVGVPLAKYLQEEFGKNWLPWLILASGDWFMVQVISKFRDHIVDLGQPPMPVAIIQLQLPVPHFLQ